MATFGTFIAGQVLTAAELNAAGTYTSYTPTWTQSATITKTVNWARYSQFNKIVVGSIKMTASSAGTANNKILVGLPVNASTNNFLIGAMTYDDASATGTRLIYTVDAYYESASTMSFFPYASQASGTVLAVSNQGVNSSSSRFGQNFADASGGALSSVTVASGDIIWIQFAYEAA